MLPDGVSTGSRRSNGIALTALLWGTAMLGLPRVASSATIWPSTTVDYITCQASIPLFAPTHVYILASGYPFWSTDPPLARQGITGAEFRIDGLPSNQFFVGIQPAPGGTIEGDFLSAGGRISFSECRPWETESCLVLLLDITVISFVQVYDGTIAVRPPAVSCNELRESTFLSLCDAPVATQLCAPTASMCINVASYCRYCPLSHPASTCTLPVAEATWSSVKALFH